MSRSARWTVVVLAVFVVLGVALWRQLDEQPSGSGSSGMPAGPLSQPEESAVQCFIYASVRQPDSYLWLAQRDDFDRLPASLRQLLGSLRFALSPRWMR